VADIWVTDITHFLDEHGAMADIPAPAQRLATYFASIIAAASNEDYYDEDDAMIVHCRRRPGRKPCSGDIISFIEPEHDEILWHCPVCKDEGVIRNWRGTLWDCSQHGLTH